MGELRRTKLQPEKPPFCCHLWDLSSKSTVK